MVSSEQPSQKLNYQDYMNCRENILEKIRQNKPGNKPLPESLSIRTEYDAAQLVVQFTESLKKAGTEVVELAGIGAVEQYISNHFSECTDLRNPEMNRKYMSDASNYELAKARAVLMHGQFGVAENGAIWIDETNFPNRLLPFISEQLVIVVTKGNIIDTMRGAYCRIKLEDLGFGLFISGPSKTADIEQSLVYGAHGAKKVNVIIH